MSIHEIVERELAARQEVKNHILQLIHERCETGNGRVQRGALHLYLYRKLGFHGHPGNHFARFLNKIIQEAGYRQSYLVGKRCYYGLSWKGEDKKNWDKPQALDIPVWQDNIEKFEFRSQP